MPEKDATVQEIVRLLPKKKIEELAIKLMGTRESVPYSADPKEMKTELETRLASFDTKHIFKKGDMVRWKKGLKNRKRPLPGEPAIVVETLKTPTYDEADSGAGSPYFREPLDIILGILDADGDFLLFYFDSRRFEPYGE